MGFLIDTIFLGIAHLFDTLRELLITPLWRFIKLKALNILFRHRMEIYAGYSWDCEVSVRDPDALNEFIEGRIPDDAGPGWEADFQRSDARYLYGPVKIWFLKNSVVMRGRGIKYSPRSSNHRIYFEEFGAGRYIQGGDNKGTMRLEVSSSGARRPKDRESPESVSDKEKPHDHTYILKFIRKDALYGYWIVDNAESMDGALVLGRIVLTPMERKGRIWRKWGGVDHAEREAALRLNEAEP
ncbi:MAG: hypothetical protein AAFX09_04335 [Pseudomonadota bacterium]